MPDDRMLHRCQGHSAKVSGLDHLTYRVWTQYLLSADDFGVLPDAAALIRGDNFALMREAESEIAAALHALEAVGLVAPFMHQGQRYYCSLEWQTYQHIRHPRNTYYPMPTAEVLRECCAETRELFRKHPSLKRTIKGGKGRVSHRLTANGSLPVDEVQEGEEAGEGLTPDVLRGLWNAAVADADLPSAAALNSSRRKHAAARLVEHDTEDWWRAYFGRIAASDFLCGRSPRQVGHENWRPSFDWVLKPENMTKVLEGAYDNRESAAAPETFTAAELAKASEVYRRSFGAKCQHDPPCETRDECIRNIIRRWRMAA